MGGLFSSLFASRRAPPRPRLKLERTPAVIYAVGDVHGCLDQLIQIERKIAEDAAPLDGDKLIVMLGDYIDRGPRSAQVIDHLIGPAPEGFERICLVGNHDTGFLSFLAVSGRSDDWLALGAEATLASYGIDVDRLDPRERSPYLLSRRLAASVPAEHITFLAGAPVLLETPDYIFVHAGLRPGRSIKDQLDQDLLWIRHIPAARLAEFGRPVIHGHTPVKTALVDGPEIAIDTAAFATGRLTAVRLMVNKAPIFLVTEATERLWVGP
ncbi:MAG: metallophosphoesterase family protein [Devosia sp.]